MDTLFKQQNVDMELIAFPLDHIDNLYYYKLKNMFKPLSENLTIDDCANFPKSIDMENIFWVYKYHDPSLDTCYWKLFCKLTNGKFAYYYATLDFDKFDEFDDWTGDMILYLSDSYQEIFQKMIELNDYKKYLNNATEVVECVLVKSCKF